ncbi:MAG TPA: acetylxylan esterase, partial [Candidatus Hydrogenedentes bacterium]|nr:acetylxylan esterase [Candidatus Hydrogenedentota bacterium]
MLKKALKIAAVVLVVLVVALWMRKAHYDAHYFDKYDPKAPLNVTVLETEELNADAPEKAYTLTKLTFDGYGGEKVPTLMAMPKKADGKRMPAVVFLHGIGQNKNFLKRITAPYNQSGFAVACFDQYTRGER